jgi:hypothetical protein
LPAPATLTGGTGTFTATLQSAGLQSLAVTDGALTGQETDIIVAPASPLTTVIIAPLTISPAAPSFGQLTSVTAQVSVTTAGARATPDGGYVVFSDNGRQVAAAPLINGSATVYTTFTGGSHYLTASYTGSGMFIGSSTAALTTINVARLATAVVLATTPTASVTAGQPVTLSAQVSGPAGIVTFRDGSTVLGAATVDVGAATASITVPSLAFGTHVLSAVYIPADIVDYAPATGSTPFAVTAAAPGKIVATSGSGQSIVAGSTFAAPLVATVTDAFGDPVAGVPVAFSTLSSGASATFTGSATAITDALGQATISVTANATGGNYTVSVSLPGGWPSATFGLTNLFASTTTLTTRTPKAVAGQAVTLTAAIAVPAGAGRPTGTVTFYEGPDALRTVALVGGKAKLAVNNLDLGPQAITAVYNGSAIFAGSTSAVLNVNVVPAASRITLASSAGNATFGDTVTWTARLAAVAPGVGIPTGTVTFMDGTTALGSATLDDGVARFSSNALAVGTHSITAVYSGDDEFLTSTSRALTQTVAKARVVVALSPAPLTATANTPITFTINVTPANSGPVMPTGTITLTDGTRAIATATLSDGTATLNIKIPRGTHTITATYHGDDDFLAGISAALTLRIQ